MWGGTVILDTKHYLPRDGDTFHRNQINYTDTVKSGTEKIWNLSDAAVTGTRYSAEVRSMSDTLPQWYFREDRTMFYQELCGDTLKCTANENRSSIMHYDRPEIMLIYPVSFGFRSSGYFHGSGLYFDKRRTVAAGENETYADASGTLILPEGDTLTDVLRVTSIRRFILRQMPKDSTQADVSINDYLASAAKNDVITTECRRWYAAGYRYPLLETQILHASAAGNKTISMATYIPLSEFDGMPDDYENKAVREDIKKRLSNLSTENRAAHGTSATKPIEYSISQDRQNHKVDVSYTVDKPVTVELILSDVTGIVYDTRKRTCQPGEAYTETIEYGGYTPAGAYVLYLRADNEQFAEKFYR